MLLVRVYIYVYTYTHTYLYIIRTSYLVEARLPVEVYSNTVAGHIYIYLQSFSAIRSLISTHFQSFYAIM